MQTTLKITSKGQITLRKDLLRELGVRPGDTVTVSVEPKGELRLKASPKGSIEDFIGCLSNDADVHLSIDEINEIIAKGWAGEL